MYLIDKEKNKISEIEQVTFSMLGFKERENLQEWIADNPNSLGEDLLIIQKEFHGFNETNERLDLLALDKQKNLVIIENKLDDSGKDVTWQALKYASYCSSLSKDNIKDIYSDYLKNNRIDKDAEQELRDFYDGEEFESLVFNKVATQRIILVAAKFRKEVTSTVMWLRNYNIRLQCITATPYRYDNKLFLNFEQIIPTKETEDFMINMAAKNQDEIVSQETIKKSEQVRLDFWNSFLEESNQSNKLFQNCSASKDHWIGTSIGVSGMNINLTITGNYTKAEIYINLGEKRLNKLAFDYLYERKSEIETRFGQELIWERMDDKVTCRIKMQKNNVSVFEKEDWPEMINFLVINAKKISDTFKIPLKETSNYLKSLR